MLAVASFTSIVDAQAADFAVSANGASAYTINGVSNPSLTLRRGYTYSFAVNSPGHPFYIKTAQVTGTGSTYDQGVGNNGTTNGTLLFRVPADAPSSLFYQCSVHSAMTGAIAITGVAMLPALPQPFLIVLLGLLLVASVVLTRKRARALSDRLV